MDIYKMSKAEFAVKILHQYAREQGINGRDTTDLSPLEKWLILQLYGAQTTIDNFEKLATNYDGKINGKRVD
jgi:hypothetical protein